MLRSLTGLSSVKLPSQIFKTSRFHDFESTSIVALVLRLSASAELLRRNLTNRGADVVFSLSQQVAISCDCSHFFPRSPSVTGLSALITCFMVSRAFNLLQVFRPALVIRYVFSRACHPLHVFPRLPSVTCFPALTLPTFPVLAMYFMFTSNSVRLIVQTSCSRSDCFFD